MLHVFYSKRIHKLITGTLCGFLLTKSSDLPFYYFLFFSIYTIMLLYIVDTMKHPVLVEDSIQEMLEDLLQAYVVLMVTSALIYVVDIRA
jgi:hypothetical protein